jgi:preprotein translocase subunit SecG
MMELVDMLGLGSSSRIKNVFRVGVQVPFLVKIITILVFSYLLYFILISMSKTLSLILRLCVNKITFILFFLFLASVFFITTISQENIINENFFHELTLRTFCFKYFFSDYLNP